MENLHVFFEIVLKFQNTRYQPCSDADFFSYTLFDSLQF